MSVPWEIPVRVKRDGRFQTLDVFELTDAELETFYSEFPLTKANSWLFLLTQMIKEERENV